MRTMNAAPRIRYKFHTSRLKYSFLYLFVIALMIGGGYFTTKRFSAALILWGAAIAIMLILEIFIRIHRLTLEDSQIIYDRGILSRRSTTTHYAAVVDIIVNQTLLQRIFGTGDIHIKTTAATEIKEILLQSFPKITLIETFIKNKVHIHQTVKK